MANKFTVDARAGFMPFDLSELQNIWTNLKDGNYWTAAKAIIHLLDDILNPTVGRTRAYPHTVEDAYRIEECCQYLEQWVEEHQGKTLQLPKLHEPNVDAVPIAEIIVLVTMLLQFISDWRKRRREQPQLMSEVTRKFQVRPNPLAKGQLMSDKKNETPSEVNRPAGVTNDQPAPMASNPSESGGKSIPVTEETNTKADTLAGEQSYAPGEAKHTKDGSDVAEQRPLEGPTPNAGDFNVNPATEDTTGTTPVTPPKSPPASTPPKSPPASTPPKSPPTPPKTPPKK